MTLSRFLRDFLYIPLGGNRGGRCVDVPQPDDHDGARRAVARRGVDVRAVGRVPRRRPGRRARARRPPARAGAGCAGSSPSTWSCSAGSCSARRASTLAGQFLVAARRARRGRRCGASPVVLGDRRRDRAAAAAGEAASSGCRCGSSASSPRCSASGFAVARRRSSARPCPARASPRSSTSASDDEPRPRRQPDEPLRRAGPAALPRARRDRRRRCSPRSLLVLFEGPSIRRAGEQMDPGVGPRRSCWRSASRPAGSPTGCRSPTLAHDATAWLSPDDELDAAAASPPTGAATGGARRAAGHRRTRSTRRARRASRRRSGRCRRCSSPATRCRRRSTPSSRARLAGDGVKVIRDPHLGTGISKSFLVDWGQLVRAPGAQRDQPDAVVVFIGANEGFPMKARRPRRRVLRRRLGGRLRQPRAPDDGHLPPERRGARLLDHAADAARPRPRSRSRASSTPRSRSRPQPWRAPGARDRHASPIFTPARLPRRDEGRRRDTIVRGQRRHPPQRDGRRRCWRRRCPGADPPGLRLLTHRGLTRLACGRHDAARHARRPARRRLRAVAAAVAASAAAAKTCSRAEYPGLGLLHLAERQGRQLHDRQEGHARPLPLPAPSTAGRAAARTKVLGYALLRAPAVDRRPRSTPRVTCKRGAKRVIYTYQQNI